MSDLEGDRLAEIALALRLATREQIADARQAPAPPGAPDSLAGAMTAQNLLTAKQAETLREALAPAGAGNIVTLYVADKDLNLVYWNENWESFARNNKGEGLLRQGVSTNLLNSMSGPQVEKWRQIYRLLLDGRLPSHEEELVCPSPVERRNFRLRITPLEDKAGRIAFLLHRLVRTDAGLLAADRVGPGLERLNDEAQMAREFRERIAQREIGIPGLNVVCHFKPLEETGGDLVWHHVYGKGVSDLAHADVVGHGRSAGRVATGVAVLLDELATLNSTVGQTVLALNRAMLATTPGEQERFATGLYFRFGQHADRVTCCSFGHVGPIFSRAGLVRIRGGFPVGLVEEDEPWPEQSLDLTEHGTRFLVFSDGITEQFDPGGAMYNTDGLHRAFLRYMELPLDEMVGRIIGDLTKFRGTALVKDDQTLIALEFVGTEESGGLIRANSTRSLRLPFRRERLPSSFMIPDLSRDGVSSLMAKDLETP